MQSKLEQVFKEYIYSLLPPISAFCFVRAFQPLPINAIYSAASNAANK